MTIFWFKIRYLLARFTLFSLRIPVTKYLEQVQELWSLSPENRQDYLDSTLRELKPLSADGKEIKSLNSLSGAAPLTKQALRYHSQKRGTVGARFSRHTAGTTGEPTNIQLSKKELARMLAVRAYCFNACGIKLGAREARLWGRSGSTIQARIRDFLLNRRVFYPVGSDAKNVVSELLHWSPEYLYGYSSLLLEAARIISEKHFSVCGIKAVICTAEMILPSQKKFLEDVFNAKVFEEYGSTEFDIIAFECSFGHRHLVNPWLLVDDDGLITDVSRETQHLVRYQQGDLIEITVTKCQELGGLNAISELKGRSGNQFAYFGENKSIHSVEFARSLELYMRINGDCFQFSVIQKEIGLFEIFIQGNLNKGSEHLRSWMLDQFKRRLNLEDDSGFSIKVNETEFLTENKKKNYFIQEL